MTGAPVLRAVLADYPHTRPLRDGTLSDPRVILDVQDVSPVHKAFAPMVRDQAYDVCELAVVSALQAIAYGRPVALLPAVVAARFQRGCLIAYRPHGVPSPQDLNGLRIGVRAYTQTTGMWVRAHLTEDFGVDTASIRWVTHDPAHVAEYRDPAFVTTPAGDKKTLDMLRDGEIDAAILGNDLPKGADFAAVIPDAAERDRAWWDTHGFMPINHMVAVGTDTLARHPDAVRAVYAMLREAGTRNAGTGPQPTIFGFERLRAPMQFIIDACLEQSLLPRRLDVDEVFAPARKLLDSAGH